MVTTNNPVDEKYTPLTKSRYDRNAARYDIRTAFMERFMMAKRRGLLWSKVEGPRILEIGVGTGASFPFYPAGVRVTAIDFSDKMLEQARQKAARDGVDVDLRQMDAQALAFPDAMFDTVTSSCVFCSVPDPILGLREAKRVLKPTGKLVMLEHVRSESPFGLVMDALNPLVLRMSGANINRRTVENVRKAGFRIESVDSFLSNIVKVIVARPD